MDLTKKEKKELEDLYETTPDKKTLLVMLEYDPISLIDMGDLDIEFDVEKHMEAVEYLCKKYGSGKDEQPN
jgi:hypothetical protein